MLLGLFRSNVGYVSDLSKAMHFWGIQHEYDNICGGLEQHRDKRQRPDLAREHCD